MNRLSPFRRLRRAAVYGAVSLALIIWAVLGSGLWGIDSVYLAMGALVVPFVAWLMIEKPWQRPNV